MLDLPLLIGGLGVLLWLRLTAPAYKFQIACQFVGTLWAQYSNVISWSLAKLVPFIAASTLSRSKVQDASLFVPYIIYSILVGLFSSLFWDIPSTANFAYGEGRILVQIIVFGSLVLATRSFASALIESDAPLLLWKALMLIGLVHGTAFIYQYLASVFGFPLIGISRAHGLTIDAYSGDVAAFAVGDLEILRPGGLAGEPKTVVVLFGIVLTVGAIAKMPPKISDRWRRLATCSLLFSVIGFIGAFSTSGFVGLALAFTALTGFALINLRKYLFVIVSLLAAYGLTNYLLGYVNLPSIAELLSLRITDRIVSGEVDAPVAASLEVLSGNVLILLIGTGLGGGTFYIQSILNEAFEYALAPNIGAVALLLEYGLIGTLLFGIPFLLLAVKARDQIRFLGLTSAWEQTFLVVLGLSTMSFMLTGSGIALGYPLAIGGILGAVNRAPLASSGR